MKLSDNLSLPFKSDLFDGLISIGVIHHLSTHKRRIKAISELVRILKTCISANETAGMKSTGRKFY